MAVQIEIASHRMNPHLANLFITTIEAVESMSSVRRKSLDLTLTTVKATQAIVTSLSERAQAQSQVRETLTIRYRAKSLAKRRVRAIQTRKNPSKWQTGKSRRTKRKSANVSRTSHVFCFDLEN